MAERHVHARGAHGRRTAREGPRPSDPGGRRQALISDFEGSKLGEGILGGILEGVVEF